MTLKESFMTMNTVFVSLWLLLLVSEITGRLVKKGIKLGISDILQFPFELNDFKDAIVK